MCELRTPMIGYFSAPARPATYIRTRTSRWEFGTRFDHLQDILASNHELDVVIVAALTLNNSALFALFSAL